MAAAAAAAGPVKDKLKTVQKQIEQLVISEGEPIKVNSFWNKFSLFHKVGHEIPEYMSCGINLFPNTSLKK